MMKRACLAALLCTATPAFAAPAAPLVRAAEPQSVVTALQNAGYKAVLSKDSDGDPKIESAAAGSKFIINFYGCAENKACRTLTFYAGWSDIDVSVDKINDWNKAKRFSRAYIDEDKDPVIEFDLDLDDGGMSEALFIDNVEFWETSVGGFKTHIND